MDGGMLQVSTMAQNQTEVTGTDHISSHYKALESQGTHFIHVSCQHDIKDLESQVTPHYTPSQDIRALESQGTCYSHACTPPNTTEHTTTSAMFNALESQEMSCISIDDLSALESQGREDTLSNELTALESQGTVHISISPSKFDALESQEMNTILHVPTASKGVLSVSAKSVHARESNALESQGKDDSPSQAAMSKILAPKLHGGTTGTSLSQESKVASGSDGKGYGNGQGVLFTDDTLPSSCFIGFLPSMKVNTLGSMVHELEQWKPAFIGPLKTVLVYKHQPTRTPPTIKPFYVTMEAQHDYLVQIE